MASNEQEWIWSLPHQDYYYVTYNEYNQPLYHWYKNLQTAVTTAHNVETANRRDTMVDSGSYPYGHQLATPFAYNVHPALDAYPVQVSQGSPPSMPEQIPYEERLRLPKLISGTPDRGWYESLDPSYRMRTGTEAREFFKKGRVFSMLHSEAASEQAARQGSDYDAVTVVKFGERVYTQIRRFVVMKVKRNMVEACAISTYSHRGTAKPGCEPSEHAPVYFVGHQWQYTFEEYGNGMTNEPIAIEPANSNLTMHPASRLRFSKTYPIEWNVKVKEIGKVIPEDMSKLISYWKAENGSDDEY